MENRLVTTQELKAYAVRLPEDISVVSFKMVNLGSNTLNQAERIGEKICEIVAQQQDFYIISKSPESIRKLLHDYIDRFCDAREGKTL